MLQALGDQSVGGEGAGVRVTLAQYLAGELSRRIKSGELTTIEGAFLHDADLAELRYVTERGQDVVSSLTGSGYHLSMYRLRD